MSERLFYCDTISKKSSELDPDTLLVLHEASSPQSLNPLLGVGGIEGRLYLSTDSTGDIIEIDQDTFVELSKSSLGGTITGVGGVLDRLYCADFTNNNLRELDKDTKFIIATGLGGRKTGIGGTSEFLFSCNYDTGIVYRTSLDDILPDAGVFVGHTLSGVGGFGERLFACRWVTKLLHELDEATLTILNTVATPTGSLQPYGVGGVKTSAVEEITVTNPSKTSNSLLLNWDTTASYFKLSYKKATDTVYTIISNIVSNSYNLTGLDENTEYDILIEGYDISDTKIGEGVNVFTTDVAPMIGTEKYSIKKNKDGLIITLDLPYVLGTPVQPVVVKYRIKDSGNDFIQLPARLLNPMDKLYIYGLDASNDYDVEIEY